VSIRPAKEEQTVHRFDDVELADHTKSSDRAPTADLDRPTQQALTHSTVAPLGLSGMSALQRAAGNAGVAGLVEEGAGDSVRSVVSSGSGRPLDDDTRVQMETGLGADFSSVRVHTGSEASRSAEAVAATAYTVGEDIVFRDGHFDPASDGGKRTLAHELTHVVQQRQGPVDGTPADGGIRVSDPGDTYERQAEASADAVMSRQADPSAPTVSREEVPEEEELQAQREEVPEEEELQAQREEEPEEELKAQSEEVPEEEE
jgi:hypothetical protein